MLNITKTSIILIPVIFPITVWYLCSSWFWKNHITHDINNNDTIFLEHTTKNLLGEHPIEDTYQYHYFCISIQWWVSNFFYIFFFLWGFFKIYWSRHACKYQVMFEMFWVNLVEKWWGVSSKIIIKSVLSFYQISINLFSWFKYFFQLVDSNWWITIW